MNICIFDVQDFQVEWDTHDLGYGKAVEVRIKVRRTNGDTATIGLFSGVGHDLGHTDTTTQETQE